MQVSEEKYENRRFRSSGGNPISTEIAVILRKTIFGRCPGEIRSEYFMEGPGLVFREPDLELAYGIVICNPLITPMMRSMLMVIQGHILRALLFQSKPTKIHLTSSLTPTKTMQNDALCTALSDIFWRAGERKSCTVCLPHPTENFLRPSSHFNEDGITEKLLLFKIESYEDLQSLIRRNLHIFQENPGPALLLIVYSSVLSRGFDRIAEDLGRRFSQNISSIVKQDTLISFSGKIIYSTLCLLMNGQATPFLHNGLCYEGNEDQLTEAQVGVSSRSPLGLLIWMGQEDKSIGHCIGSRLKTPIFPIWITIVRDNPGVMFSRNRELMRDYHVENRFDLHYYGSTKQNGPVLLRVTTKTEGEEKKRKSRKKGEVFDLTDEPEPEPHPLVEIIRTKWSEATVNWSSAKILL